MSRDRTALATEPWPNGARIAASTSLMFEAGSQDMRHELGPIPLPQVGELPDLPTNSWFDYAENEGIPRALDSFDRSELLISHRQDTPIVHRGPVGETGLPGPAA
jgi:hypothetical protein